MDLSRLPFLTIDFFLHPYSRARKRIFWVMAAASALACGLYVFVQLEPTFFPLTIHEASDFAVEAVTLKTVEYHYRSVDVVVPAYRQMSSFAASPLLPHPVPVYAWVVLCVLAWAMVLVAATETRGVVPYLLYILTAVFVHLSRIHQVILPTSDAIAVEVLLLGLLLGLAYAFQVSWLRVGMGWRAVVLGGVMLGAYGLGLGRAGMAGALYMVKGTLGFQTGVGLLLLLFMGKELTSGLLLLGTNWRNAAWRIPFGGMVAVMVCWLLLLTALVVPYFEFKGAARELFGIRAGMLVAASAAAMVFLSQNIYNGLREFFSNFAYTLLLLCWGIIGVGQFMLLEALGDVAYGQNVARIGAISMLGVGTGFVLYVFLNHAPLLRKRLNAYYLIGRGRVFPYSFMFIIGLAVLLVVEGRVGWRTFTVTLHSSIVADGDHALATGRAQEARKRYAEALKLVPVSVKANYNLAGLLIAAPDDAQEAVEYYQRATSYYRFPFATLNAANALLLAQQPAAAERLLRRGVVGTQRNNAYLCNNLAMMLLARNQPDSAIVYLRLALENDLSLSGAYSNLSEIYYRNRRPDDARQFLQAALDVAQPSPSAVANAIFHRLTGAFTGNIPSQTSDDFLPLTYNALLWRIREGRTDEAARLVARATQAPEAPPALASLDAYLKFAQDSVAAAISKVAYIAEAHPEVAAEAQYLLGIAYLERGVPEMARKYFRRAGQSGNPHGYLNAARMEVELGRYDSAFRALGLLRVRDTTMAQPVAREVSVLQRATGQALYAELEYPAAKLTFGDWVRVGIVADSAQQYILAVEAFRQGVRLDSTSPVPYIELAKIYTRHQDPQKAYRTLEDGLAALPDNPWIRLQAAELALAAGNVPEVRTLAQRLASAPETAHQASRLLAKALLAEGNIPAAQAELEKLHAQFPLDTDVLLTLGGIYEQARNYERLNPMLNKALALNDENPLLWWMYARALREWNQASEAGFAAGRALALTENAALRDTIIRQFADELALFRQP